MLGYGSPAQLQPLRSAAGPLLVPIDRALMDLVWHNSGYPSAAAYRNTRNHTEYRHTPWAVDGAPYDPARGAPSRSRAHARDFAEAAARRLEGGGLAVCALDTELLGHFWHEGVDWLAATIEACERGGRRAAAARRRAAPASTPRRRPPSCPTRAGASRAISPPGARRRPPSSRGRRARRSCACSPPGRHPAPRALRELMALQASDWAFGVTRETAGPYSRERALGHAAELERGARRSGRNRSRAAQPCTFTRPV